MKVNIVTRVTIADSPDNVFDYLTNLKYHYLWNPQLQDISPIIKLEQGSTYKTVSKVLGMKLEATNKVVKLVRDQEIEIINSTGNVQYKVNFKIERTGKNTRLTCDTQVSADSATFAFSAPVLKLLARRELQTDMQALKLAVENKLT